MTDRIDEESRLISRRDVEEYFGLTHRTLHCPATQSHRSVRSIEIPVLCPRRFGASQGAPSITAGSSVA